MNPDTDQLIAAAVDGRLDAEGAALLAAQVRADPEVAGRLRAHLVIAELLAHERSSSRSGEAFVAGIDQRRRNVGSTSRFVRSVMASRRSRAIRLRRRWMTLYAAAAMLVLAMGGAWWWLVQTAPEMAVLDCVANEVQVIRDGRPVAAAARMVLQPADRIEVADVAGPVAVSYADGTAVRIRPASRLRLSLTAGAKRLDLDRGEVRCTVAPQPAGRPLCIDTPHSRITVVGTVFAVATDADATRLTVERGLVRFTDRASGDTSEVGAGASAVVRTTPPPVEPPVAKPVPAEPVAKPVPAEPVAKGTPVLLADFRNPGQPALVGARAELVNNANVSTAIGNALPPLAGADSYLRTVVTKEGWHDLVKIMPADPGSSFACFNHGTVERGGRSLVVLEGGYDVLVRLTAKDPSDVEHAGPGRSGMWFRPCSFNRGKGASGVGLILNGLGFGAVTLCVLCDRSAIHDFERIRGTGTERSDTPTEVMLTSATDLMHDVGTTYHVAFTFSTDRDGLITVRLFLAPEAVAIRTDQSTHLCAEARFSIDASVTGAAPIAGNVWWMEAQVGAVGAGTIADYAWFRLYNADPGVFTLPDAGNAAPP